MRATETRPAEHGRPSLDALRPGLGIEHVHIVQTDHLATAWRNDVSVLATPVLLWWAELAAASAVGPHLAQPWGTVGAAHDTRHLAPTRLDAQVTVTAELISWTPTLLKFAVKAHDGLHQVLSGTHTRGVVDLDQMRSIYGPT